MVKKARGQSLRPGSKSIASWTSTNLVIPFPTTELFALFIKNMEDIDSMKNISGDFPTGCYEEKNIKLLISPYWICFFACLRNS